MNCMTTGAHDGGRWRTPGKAIRWAVAWSDRSWACFESNLVIDVRLAPRPARCWDRSGLVCLMLVGVGPRWR